MDLKNTKKENNVFAWVIHVFAIVSLLIGLSTLSFVNIFKTGTEADIIWIFAALGVYTFIGFLSFIILVLSLIYFLRHKFNRKPHSQIIFGYLLAILVWYLSNILL